MILRKPCTCPDPLACGHDWSIVRPTVRVRLRRWFGRRRPGACPACGEGRLRATPIDVVTLNGPAWRAVTLAQCPVCGWTASYADAR